MITDYALNMKGWQDWQKEYRYGVILIIPPDPPLSEVNKLREKCDPAGYAILGAHISLTLQIARGVAEDDWKELKKIAARIKPVTITYGPLSNFLPVSPGVFLTIEPKGALEQILVAVEKAAVFKGAPPRRFPFLPHMTIAEFNQTPEKTRDLTARLKDTAPQGSFFCNYLSYAAPDESFHFTERARLELGG